MAQRTDFESTDIHAWKAGRRVGQKQTDIRMDKQTGVLAEI